MCSHFPLLRLINNKYSCTSLSVYVVKDINTNSSSYPFEIVLPYKDRIRSIMLEALREKSNRNSEKTFLLWKHRELELKTDDRGCGGLSFVSRKGIAWLPKCCPCTETSFLILLYGILCLLPPIIQKHSHIAKSDNAEQISFLA